jgi:hypothetical protein
MKTLPLIKGVSFLRLESRWSKGYADFYERSAKI